ncbi:HAD family hydrolase [Mycobacterium sp. NPDC003449]
MAFDLNPKPELLTFDCYGTLIDWDSALRGYVADLLKRKNLSVDPAEFYHGWYYRHALRLLQGPFIIYRDLLKESMQAALREYGATVTDADGADCGDAMAEAEPFPDTVDVLHELAGRYRLAIISNSQDDIVSHAVKRMDNLFSVVITAETTRAYKPDSALFELVLQRSAVPVERTVHIAQSQYVDLPRSVPMGFRTIWINRNGQKLNEGTPEPDETLADLRALPALLTA